MSTGEGSAHEPLEPPSPESGQTDHAPGAHHHDPLPPLPLGVRILLYFVGWLLLLLGAAALVLPGPGLLGLALGAAALSVASEAIYRRLHRTLHPRWPAGAEHLKRLRRSIHERLHRR